MAEKHSLFAGGLVAFFSFAEYFSVQYPELYVDYLLPVGLPFSFGASTTILDPDTTRFGLRIGYHVNLDDEHTDVYALYTLDYVSDAEGRFLEYGGRIGIRRLLGDYICVTLETGFRLLTVNFGISIKLN
jgi:hypothetical protein